MAKQNQKFGFGAVNAQKGQASSIINASIDSVNEKIADKKERTYPFEVKLIPRSKIKLNTRNITYKISDIDKLMDSILNFGLSQNLTAVYSMEEDVFILEAGHRRTQALDNLIEKYKNIKVDLEDENYKLYQKNVAEYEKGYPIRVTGVLKEDIIYDEIAYENLDDTPTPILESEIRLHITNQEIREQEQSERAKSIQRLGHLYEAYNKRIPKHNRININKIIGEEVGISERQVSDIRVTEKLIPELQELFDENSITLKKASAYARLDADDQKVILDMIKKGTKVTNDEISFLKKEKAQMVASQEKLAKDLKNKENELEELKLQFKKNSSKKKEEQLNEQISNLSEEIEKLNNQSNNSSTLSAEQTLAIKKEMSLKEQFAIADKTLSNLYLAVHDYNKQKNLLPKKEKDVMELMDNIDISSNLEKLIATLNTTIKEQKE